MKVSANHVYDYMEMGDYSIYEIQPLEQWVGKSIKETDFRAKYNANILGIKREGKSTLMPSADYVFNADEHLMVIGKKIDIEKLVRRL